MESTKSNHFSGGKFFPTSQSERMNPKKFLIPLILIYFTSCSSYKVNEIKSDHVLEKELRAHPEPFRDDTSREFKEREEGKKGGKKK